LTDLVVEDAPVRPYVVVSGAMSVDGCIDDASDRRLLLSSDEDFDRVDAVRATCDALLVGAATIRADDPRLVIRSPQRRRARVARGLPEDPVKATITVTGDLDARARFFTVGEAPKLVYGATPSVARTGERLGHLATVVDAGQPVVLGRVLGDLASRGVERLMVEGGSRVTTWFLTAGVVDELHLVVAPFFVGDPAAPRFVGPGEFPHGPGNPMTLAEVRQLDGVVLLRYLLRPAP
jgi:5-amino-6-(5-phosphoribosylamino)uracil reductase